jgi:hypothetical protein
MSKRIKKHRGGPAERVAVFTSYGTHEQVECVTVVIQDGGVKSGGKVLDSRRFWSRDYRSPEELMQSALKWALARGANRMAQVNDVLPLEECKDTSVRAVD